MPASRGSEEGCRPGVRASPPRVLKLRSRGSGPWLVFVHRQIRKIGVSAPGKVWRSCPGPRAPTALCLRLCCKETLGGRPLAFVLGSGLSMQVCACEGAPPGSPSCQDPPTHGLGIAVTLSSELFTAHITAGPARPRTGACRTLTAVTSPRLVKPLLGSG